VSGNNDADVANAFVTTQWSVVLAAQERSPAAEAALEKLCRTYWRPIYWFIRRQGRETEDAKDLTQGFFALLLERRDFDAVRREKGRLRSYLLVALKHFLFSEHIRDTAVKRGAGRLPIPLEEMLAREGDAAEPVDNLTADRIYEHRWAMTVLDEALGHLGADYMAQGNHLLFDRFKRLLADESDASQARIANDLSMSENSVKQAYHRFRLAYREAVRQEIANTVALPGDIDDEMRHLISAVRS
jgi:RNA polymerase sigma factor (sigma-70 family)